MRQLSLGAAIAAVTLCAAPAAIAATFSYTATGNYDDGNIFPPPPFLSAGEYKITWSSTFPLSTGPFALTFDDDYIFTFNIFDKNHVYQGGDDEMESFHFNLSPGASGNPNSVSATILIPALPADGSHVIDAAGDVEYDSYIGMASDLEFSADPSVGAGTFTFSIAGIPEPSAWMLMLAGLSLVGAGLRARRARPQTYAGT